MISAFIQLGLTLFLIYLSSEIFTNAIEHLGEQANLSENVTGSIFAAIATALPETMVPLIAIVAGTKDTFVNEQISVGAILGAPMMLSTITVTLLGIFAIKWRGLFRKLKPEVYGLKKDLNFVILAFSIVLITLFVPHDYIVIRVGFCAVMILIYLTYIYQTLNASDALVKAGHNTKSEQELFLKRLGLPTTLSTIILQCLISIFLLVIVAKLFIHVLIHIAELYAISPLILSLFIVPIGTELPEKMNSLLWLKKGKDTLAIGNITGAMVFQGTMLPAIGILLTPWQASIEVLFSVLITLAGTLWLRVNANPYGLPAQMLIVNGSLYLFYFYMIVNHW